VAAGCTDPDGAIYQSHGKIENQITIATNGAGMPISPQTTAPERPPKKYPTGHPTLAPKLQKEAALRHADAERSVDGKRSASRKSAAESANENAARSIVRIVNWCLAIEYDSTIWMT
jgi:hypothetical protein